MRNIKQHVTYLGEELQERVEYWQKLLRLQDWIVTAKVARYYELEHHGCDAQILHSVPNKEADLLIMDPGDVGDGEPHDMDWLIVHELLHLHTTPIYEDEDKDVEAEQAIESITYGLIALERRGQDDGNDL